MTKRPTAPPDARPPDADSEATPLIRVVDGQQHWIEDRVALEAPLTLMLNGREWVTLLATPTHLDELVLGFLAAEGVVQHPDDVSRVVWDAEDGRAWVRCPALTPATRDALLVGRRTLSACCGRGHPGLVFASDTDVPPVPTGPGLRRLERLPAWVDALDRSARAFQDTGGLHTVALAPLTDNDSTDGSDGASPPDDGVGRDFLVVRSDVGRHNALDKVAGWCLMHDAPQPGALAIVFSGRVSAEVVVKAARLGAALVVSHAAPTTLGLQMADALHVTVVAFVRGERLSVYTHPERLGLGGSPPAPY